MSIYDKVFKKNSKKYINLHIACTKCLRSNKRSSSSTIAQIYFALTNIDTMYNVHNGKCGYNVCMVG